MVPLPTAAEEVEIDAWVFGGREGCVYVCVCVWGWGWRSEAACFSASLLGLLYFLVAGAPVRSLPADPLVHIRGLQPFPVCREEEANKKQDEHPGKEGSERGGRGWNW